MLAQVADSESLCLLAPPDDEEDVNTLIWKYMEWIKTQGLPWTVETYQV